MVFCGDMAKQQVKCKGCISLVVKAKKIGIRRKL